MNRIAGLYAIETEGQSLSTEERQRLRAEKSLPALTDLYDWLRRTRIHTASNSATAKAIKYSLKRWAVLTRYTQTGDLPIDNNQSKTAFVRLPWVIRTGSSPAQNAPEGAPP